MCERVWVFCATAQDKTCIFMRADSTEDGEMNHRNQLKLISSWMFLIGIICAAAEGNLALVVISIGLFIFVLSTREDNN
jgi:hypothetical protein